jgi:hypothetical protein
MCYCCISVFAEHLTDCYKFTMNGSSYPALVLMIFGLLRLVFLIRAVAIDDV